MLAFVVTAVILAQPITVNGRFDPVTDHLLIPVGINGERFWCSLDSGFSALLSFDERRAQRAQLQIEPGRPTPDGNPPGRGDRSATAAVHIGELTLPRQTLIIRAFDEEMTDTDCVMGVGVLRPRIVEMDYMTATVRLFNRDDFRTSPRAREIPLLMRRNTPFLDVGIRLRDGTEHTAHVVVDTGTAYYSLALVDAFVQRARVSDSARTAVRPNRPQAEVDRPAVVATRLPALTAGPFTSRDRVAALIDPRFELRGVHDGLLGSGFLRQFTVTFDFEGARLFLEPNARHDRPQLFDAGGVGFRRNAASDAFQVIALVAGSPAARAGVRVGDILISVGGKPPGAMTTVQLAGELSVPGTAVDLRLRRDGKDHDVTLRLEDRLPGQQRPCPGFCYP